MNPQHLKEVTTEAAVVAALTPRPETIDAGLTQFVLIPPGWQHRNIEEMQSEPMRQRGVTMLATVDALARFVALFPEQPTQVAAQRENFAIVAVLNPNTQDVAGWGDWGAQVNVLLDPCLQKWKDLAGKWLTQEQFSEFLRERGPDVSVPRAGALIDFVEHLEVHTGVKGKFKRNAQNGATTILWEEETKSETPVPESFTLKLPCFLQSETLVEMEARLTWRAKDGALHWRFLLDEFAAAMDAAWDAEVKKFAEHPALPPGVKDRIFAA